MKMHGPAGADIAHTVEMKGREAEMSACRLEACRVESAVELRHRSFGVEFDLLIVAHSRVPRLGSDYSTLAVFKVESLTDAYNYLR